MFDVGDRHYTIFTWMDEGIGINEQYPNDGDFQYFETAEDLVNNFMVDGKFLGELVDRVIITEYT